MRLLGEVDRDFCKPGPSRSAKGTWIAAASDIGEECEPLIL